MHRALHPGRSGETYALPQVLFFIYIYPSLCVIFHLLLSYFIVKSPLDAFIPKNVPVWLEIDTITLKRVPHDTPGSDGKVVGKVTSSSPSFAVKSESNLELVMTCPRGL